MGRIEFRGWGSTILGVCVGALGAFFAYNRTGSAWCWLMIPGAALLFAFNDGNDGPAPD